MGPVAVQRGRPRFDEMSLAIEPRLNSRHLERSGEQAADRQVAQLDFDALIRVASFADGPNNLRVEDRCRVFAHEITSFL